MKPTFLTTALLLTFAGGTAFAADRFLGSVSTDKALKGDHRAPPVHERGPPRRT
jgi:hypothetical protein